MPIRMVEDDPQGNKNQRASRRSRSSKSSRSKGGSGIGGGLGGIVGSLLPMLMKRPKILIGLIVVGVIVYFVFGRGGNPLSQEGGISSYFTGGNFDKEKYESTEIFEPLADNVKNPLPNQVSLRKYAPKVLNQGQQGSCVAWASAYAARTILESRRTGKSPNSVRFSPSFMYNQISTDHSTCQGSYIKLAMENMMDQGAVQFADFKYDQSNCSRKPSSSLKAKADKYKIKGFQRLTENGQSLTEEMLSIKQNLAQGSPVIIGMMVGGSFMTNMSGKDLWKPKSSDYSQRNFGGHAMCIIGYDDYKGGGSFEIMNSWGESWGDKGFFWIRYSDFKEFNVESYGLYPMGNAAAKNETRFKGSFGLEINSGNKVISLVQKAGTYFESTRKLSKSDKFKVEFTNNVECYTYIFGEETDGTSYVLFPYTKKHSPYCGITGTRLFPRDYSMQADNLGVKDKIAVVITRSPIDYNALNEKIKKARGNSYEEKLQNALAGKLDENVRFSGSKIINFEATATSGKYIAFVIGVNK